MIRHDSHRLSVYKKVLFLWRELVKLELDLSQTIERLALMQCPLTAQELQPRDPFAALPEYAVIFAS